MICKPLDFIPTDPINLAQLFSKGRDICAETKANLIQPLLLRFVFILNIDHIGSSLFSSVCGLS